jgi:hypothetical protein
MKLSTLLEGLCIEGVYQKVYIKVDRGRKRSFLQGAVV